MQVLNQHISLSPDLFGKQILDLDNEFLILPFLEDEVKEAIWSCESFKSPGPDGFNFNFLKTNFKSLMEEFHLDGKLVKGLNPSFIVLIPKKGR